MIVYLVTNRVNGKRYVGKTIRTLERRWYEHVTHSHGGSQEMALYAAIRKHGAESFDLSVLEACENEEQLDVVERKWIHELGTYGREYNMTEGGDGLKGYKHTEKTKRKMSESRRGKKMSEANRLKLIEHNRNRVVSEETREKMRQARLGVARAPETCAKITEALRKRVRKTKQVIQKRDGAILAIFSSAKEAAAVVNGNVNHIRECCLGTTNRRTHRGYDWSYTE